MNPSAKYRFDDALESRYQTLIIILAAAAAAVGVLVIAGWVLGIEALVRLHPGFNGMKFNTALCLIASGCGLLLLLSAQAPWRLIAARALGLFVFSIGSMSLFENLCGWNLHIDQLFWNDLRWHPQTLRMVLQTALFFALAGPFLWLSTSRRRAAAWLAPVLALGANLTAQAAVLDLIFRENKLQVVAGNTAGSLLALSLGMLLFPNRQGMLAPLLYRTGGGKIIRWLLPAATLGPLLTGSFYFKLTQTQVLSSSSGMVVMVIAYSTALLLITIWTANSIDNVDLRLEAIIEGSDDAIITRTPDGMISAWNPGAQRLFGYTAGEAIGKPLKMLVPADRERELADIIVRSRNGKQISHFDTVRLRKDGSQVEVSISVAPVRNARGEIIALCAIARDITHRRKAQQRLEMALTAAQLGTWELDLVTNITERNLRHDQIFGYKAALPSFGVADFYDRVHAGDRDIARQAIENAVLSGHLNFDCRIVWPDSSIHWINVQGIAQMDAAGNPLKMFGTVADITERKQAEAEIRELNQDLENRVEQRTIQLQESERQVRRKLDAIISPEGDIATLELHDVLDIEPIQALMDDLWNLTHIPVAILDLHGNVLVGAGWQDICTRFHRLHPETCKNCLESDCRLTTGVPAREFRLYKCKNSMWDVVTPLMLGERHIGNLFSGQFLFEDDKVDYELFRAQARKYSFDESEYIAALERVPRLSRARMNTAMEMYSRLAGLLSTLGYGRVKLARAMAETSRTNSELLHTTRELEHFAYSVSHDLRAPLRHLDGFLALLSKRNFDSLDERGKHYIKCMLEASQRMGRLIDELLRFSRLGRAEMRRGQVDLNQLIAEARAELEPDSRGRRIVWQIEDLPVVTADRPMLRQVIENLLANALKFTRTRQQAVIVIGTMSQEGMQAFFVKDNGAGFDMRYSDKLFQVFQRLHGEEEFEGTGIGLANVRRIIERHGGQVWAEGAVDKGATFYFSLPQDDTTNGVSNEPIQAHIAG